MEPADTGYVDRNGKQIREGDWLSLDGNMTATDGFLSLPSGWVFMEDDVYKVICDERVCEWSLDLGIEPDTAYNCKYMNHAVGLFHNGDAEIVEKPNETV